MASAKFMASARMALLTAIGFEGNALAYCVARECDPDARGGESCELDPETRCSVEGVELRRNDGCVDLAFRSGSAQPSVGLTDAEFEQTVMEAFALWTEVDCGEGPPGLIVQSAGAVSSQGPFSCELVPEANLAVWEFSDELPSPPVLTASTGAVAGVTHPAFFLDSGEIFDTDVELNELWFLLHDAEEVRGYLRTVAAHEAGHVLGLAHSLDPTSLMFRSYVVEEGRRPNADDTEGICRLYPTTRLQCPKVDVEDAALSDAACTARYESRNEDNGANPDMPACELAGPARAPSRSLLDAGLALFVAAVALGAWVRRRNAGAKTLA